MAQPQRRSKEAALECLTALIALGILFYFFSPGFRSFINTILLVLAAIGLIAFAVWMFFKITKNEPPPTFEAIYHEAGQAKKPLGDAPLIIQEKARHDPPTPELAVRNANPK